MVETRIGKPMPLGAHPHEGGTQFALFSRHAVSVSLLLFDNSSDAEPSEEFVLNPIQNKTGDVWHVFVPGAGPGTLYLYRVGGPFEPTRGHRFNRNVPLLDPYAKALTGDHGRRLRRGDGEETLDASGTPKCIVIDDHFDWQGDRPLNYPLRFSVIYEAHVKGLTAGPGADVAHPGTYRGVIEKIPYFKDLGVTSLELLPIMEFDEHEFERTDPLTGRLLSNYWGYSTMSFFAPKGGYASDRSAGRQVAEFKEMVRELHKAGIEVILDVVFNHTGEGNEQGPTYCYRGLDNSIYYMLDSDKRRYKNYSGCGNTFNCNHPIVRNLIIDSLHYWVVEMHVDGFRFDLGSILGRDPSGRLLENPPMLEMIAEDPVLRQTKIIAEAWDAGGAYQVGGFPGGRWAEWNDRFRDDVRRFWRGDPGTRGGFATRVTGSSDLYLRDGRKPFHSINFVTSHDGFTLNDLVTYAAKHNEANGEDSRDGSNNNNSANFGVEGPTKDRVVEATRNRMVKNFLTTLMLSLGTPMLLGGDEFRRSQGGNNNAYCQDNEVSWFDWRLLERHGDVYDFTRKLIRFRLRHHAFLRPEFYTGEDANYNAMPDITWYNEKGKAPDWALPTPLIALRIDGSEAKVAADRDDNDFYLMFNATTDAKVFVIHPPRHSKRWYRVIDTAAAPPRDFLEAGNEEPLADRTYSLRSRSCVVLLSR